MFKLLDLLFIIGKRLFKKILKKHIYIKLKYKEEMEGVHDNA